MCHDIKFCGSLCLCLLFSTCFGYNSIAQSVSTADELIKISENLAWTDYDSSINLLEATIAQFDEHIPKVTGDLCIALSKVYNIRRECDAIEYWNKKADNIYQEINDRRGQGEVLFQQGYLAFCRKDYETALEEILRGLKIMEELKDRAGVALGHLRMSRIFHFTAKMAQSAEYGELAAPQFEKDGDYINAWDSWSFAGHGYRMVGDNDKALRCFDRGMQMALRSGLSQIKGMAYNDLAAFYNEIDAYDSAIVYFQKALDHADPDDERQIMVTKNGLAQSYLHSGQFQKCIDVLAEPMEIVRRTQEVFFLTELPEYIAQSYAGLGQYDSAYKYMEMNWQYSDSLFKANQDLALEEMRSKYESDRKDQLLAQRDRERQYGIALLLAILIMGFMFYRRYVNKQKTNEILNESNREKDFLLKEIHHRVKNNLQILSSLLNLQSDYIEDKGALDAISEGGNRVQSMAFIHQQLYSKENMTAVNMSNFLADLCGHLQDSFSTDKKKINITYDIRTIDLDVETAIPLGLIVNELITNSIKHAFRKKTSGSIKVKLWENTKNQLCLEVSDDGDGQSPSQFDARTPSFGTDLVAMLSKKLKGELSTETTDQGYTTLLTFSRYKLAVQT